MQVLAQNHFEFFFGIEYSSIRGHLIFLVPNIQLTYSIPRDDHGKLLKQISNSTKLAQIITYMYSYPAVLNTPNFGSDGLYSLRPPAYTFTAIFIQVQNLAKDMFLFVPPTNRRPPSGKK